MQKECLIAYQCFHWNAFDFAITLFDLLMD